MFSNKRQLLSSFLTGEVVFRVQNDAGFANPRFLLRHRFAAFLSFFLCLLLVSLLSPLYPLCWYFKFLPVLLYAGISSSSQDDCGRSFCRPVERRRRTRTPFGVAVDRGRLLLVRSFGKPNSFVAAFFVQDESRI
jgi:hypothetical protein